MSSPSFNIFLANPAPAAERLGVSFMTPRALPVLAAATPADFGGMLRAIDQTIEEFPFDELKAGDLVGISIHTINAIHGYTLATKARKHGASVVFGGPHASIFPNEALQYGDAVVTGDAEVEWPNLLRDFSEGRLKPVYQGGRVGADRFVPARWDILQLDRYLIATIQTVRGCPKQCSFCSVWVQDGRVPRVRATDAILAELHVLYEAGFRLVFFADDNFYPHTLGDIAASRSPEARRTIEDGRNERLELLHRLATELPPDMHFCTQITMEVADDPEFMAAMKRGRIEGALIGIETINEAGLKATNKSFNSTGAELVRKLETIRRDGLNYIMGAFIFGLESDTSESLAETIRFARDCGLALAQFIPMTPLPGTVDFQLMRRGKKTLTMIKPDYDYWLDPEHPRILFHHPHLDAEQILEPVERAWRSFYSVPAIVKRARQLGLLHDPRKLLAYYAVCKGLLTRYRRYGLSADSAVSGTNRKVARLLGRLAISAMKRKRREPFAPERQVTAG
jgi:radical SAM superfamily enzyme YgiQ (UPF0313 family)